METQRAEAALDGAQVQDVTGEVWRTEHFDHLSPDFSRHFDETVDYMRSRCPVAHSDQHGGFWVVSDYDDVLRVLRDWRTFSNARGVSIPMQLSDPPLPPEEFDPPLQHAYKRLMNAYLTPTRVQPWEEPTRAIVTRLIDGFIEDGRCEFMSAFAGQLPRLSFFQLVMDAPADDLAKLNNWTKTLTSGIRDTAEYPVAQANLNAWIEEFIAARRAGPRRDDIVDAIVNGEIDGRPISDEEIIGSFVILMFGGFETTASALGSIMIRAAEDPAIFEGLCARPDLIPLAIEEFLRIDPPVVCMARSTTSDVELGGQELHAGDKVLFSIAGANRDAVEFPQADELVLDRSHNRHLSFGAGPHRCAGSNLARQSLRVALQELTTRLADIRLECERTDIPYATAFNRAPIAVPITFRKRA